MATETATRPLDRAGVWLSAYPETSAQRFFHRLPVWLWRLGLGPLLGREFMLLTTRGGRTGLPRRAGLTAHHLHGRLYAWCPYGDRGYWFRNLAAQPLVTVQTSAGSGSARAVRIGDESEAGELYDLLRAFDPRMLHEYLAGEEVPDRRGAFVAARRRLHVVRLEPSAEPGPAGVGRDLLWVWPAAMAGVLGVLFASSVKRRHTP